MWGGGGRRKDVEWVGKGGVVAVSRKCCTTLPSHGWACVGIERGLGGGEHEGREEGIPTESINVTFPSPFPGCYYTDLLDHDGPIQQAVQTKVCVCVCMGGWGSSDAAI